MGAGSLPKKEEMKRTGTESSAAVFDRILTGKLLHGQFACFFTGKRRINAYSIILNGKEYRLDLERNVFRKIP